MNYKPPMARKPDKPPKHQGNDGCPPGEGTIFPAHGGQIGMPPHVPTDEGRAFVVENACKRGRLWCAVQLGISKRTLFNHYDDEIQLSKANATAEVGMSLFEKAKAGDGASMRFFLITQGGGDWSPKVRHEHTGPGGGPMQNVDLTKLLEGKSDDEIRNIIGALEILSAAGGSDIAGGYSGIDTTGEG